jgi:hypothetical protein
MTLKHKHISRGKMKKPTPPARKTTISESIVKAITDFQIHRTSSPRESATMKLQKSDDYAEDATPSISSESVGLQESRRELAAVIEAGTIDEVLFKILYTPNQGFAKVEGKLLDYKRDAPTTPTELAKLIKHIAAFHNTYGGIILFGVAEKIKEQFFCPYSEAIHLLDPKKIKDLCRKYLSSSIDISVHQLNHPTEKFSIQVLYIPKRETAEPVFFETDSPASDDKKIFRNGDIPLRDGDNSIIAIEKRHYRTVFGQRQNPYAAANDKAAPEFPVEGLLPDRSFICQDFIGREDILQKLYDWLKDDYGCVRVIAGEGGLGKTSIAYEFIADVAKYHLSSPDHIAWLTAKKIQFRALSNEYVELPETHFSNADELVRELARHFAATEEEIEDLNETRYTKFLSKLARELRIFAVVDDLDSLEIDDQRRCIEICQQLAGSGSRFLFTTRKNATASSTTAIELKGLPLEDYQNFIASWTTRLEIASLSEKAIIRLHEESHGSPLYSESILRLIRSGMSYKEAIASWKGNLGLEVRKAALSREVFQLSTEARKVLVTVAILVECSMAELKQATEFSEGTLTDAINELQSLFLLGVPGIAGQTRYGISNTTRDLVISLAPQLTPGFSAFKEGIQKWRHKVKGKASKDIIGSAINQAMAQISAGEPQLAIETIDEVNLKYKNRHPDLLYVRARALTNLGTQREDEASRTFANALTNGQRKAKFFEKWFQFEIERKSFEKAIEVCNNALSCSSGDAGTWHYQRAYCRLIASKQGDADFRKLHLRGALTDLRDASSYQNDLQWQEDWQEYLYEASDALWTILARGTGLPDVVDLIDALDYAIKAGDRRVEIFNRLAGAVDKIYSSIYSTSKTPSQRAINLVEQQASRVLSLLNSAPNNIKTSHAFQRAYKTVSQRLGNHNPN